MNDVIIRQATIEDLPMLLTFEQGIIIAERPFDPTLVDGHFNYYDLKAMIPAEDAAIYVAQKGDELVGSGSVLIADAKPYLKHNSYAHIGFMFVKPEFRGQGISQAILEELRNWSVSKNLVEFRLKVYDDNPRAIRAYEKAGFKKHLIEMRYITPGHDKSKGQ